MKLTIVRHGETIENSLSICQGQSEGTLSGKGLEQAQKVAERLKSESFDLAFSSDLKRAKKTAEIILRNHNMPLKLDKRLRERHFGAIQGKQVKGYDINDQLPDDAESNSAIVQRHKEFYDELFREHYDKNILIVSHGIAKKALLTAVFDLPHEKINELERFGNTSVTIIVQEKNNSPQALLRNCMAHL